jgi:hypothetical protein
MAREELYLGEKLILNSANQPVAPSGLSSFQYAERRMLMGLSTKRKIFSAPYPNGVSEVAEEKKQKKIQRQKIGSLEDICRG